MKKNTELKTSSLFRSVIIYLLIFVSCLLVFIEAADFYLPAYRGLRSGGDAEKYYLMSEDTFSIVGNPFESRILSPLIVHKLHDLLNLPLDYGWMLLTFVCIFVSLVIFYNLLCSQLKIDTGISLAFTLILLFTYYFSYYNFSDFWLIDPLNNLLVILGIILILKENIVGFSLVMIIGFLNKEAILLLLPLYFFNILVKKPLIKKQLSRASICLFAVVIIYILFKMVLQNLYGLETNIFAGINGKTFADNIKLSLNSNKDIYSIFHLLDFIWVIFVLAIYQIGKEYSFAHKYIILPIILLSLLIFSRMFVTDTQRIFVMAAPIIIAVSASFVNLYRDSFNKIYLIPLILTYLALNFNWIPKQTVVIVNLIVSYLIIWYFDSCFKKKKLNSNFPNQ